MKQYMDGQKLTQKLLKKKSQYELWVARPSTIQRDEVAAVIINKIVGSSILAISLPEGNTDYFAAKSKFNNFYNSYAKKLAGSKNIAKHFKQYQTSVDELLMVSRSALRVAPNRKDLLNIFQNWIKTLEGYSLYLLTPYLIESKFEPLLKDKLAKKYKNQYEDILKIIASPTMVFEYQKYQLDLVRAKNPKDLQSIVAKYRWVTEYSYKEKLLDIQMAKDELKKIHSEKAMPEILKVNQNIKNNLKLYKNLISSLSRDPELKSLVELVHNYVNIRTLRIEVFKEAQANLRVLYQQLAVYANNFLPSITYFDIISLTNDEIIDFLCGDITPDLKEVRKRQGGKYVFYKNKKGKHQFIYQKNLVSILRDNFIEIEIGQVKELTGIITNRGQAQGRVKIINNKKDFSKFKSGDILVAQFTTPDFVSIMKKSAAIITNDGGITCHAAIISRELDIPCIVGTKIATKVLKDGMMVEVDAERGIVKILK